MAGLRKLKGKYYIRLWIDGKEKILPTGTAIVTDAERQLRKIQRQEVEIKQRIRQEIDEVNRRLTIAAGVDYFLKNVQAERGLRNATLVCYKKALVDFQNCFAAIPTFDNLNRSNFPELVAYLEERYNPTTVNIRLRGIRAMLHYLVDKELIKLPFAVKMVKTDQSLPKFMTPEEIDRIYSQVTDPKMLATFRVFEATGMRVGELAESELRGDFLFVRQSKNRKQRLIPLPPGRIIDYQVALQDKPYTASTISHAFTKAVRKAGVERKTIHALRHTFALRKILETNNLILVKELLGHSSVKVTEIYLQFPPDFLSRIFNQRAVNRNFSQGVYVN